MESKAVAFREDHEGKKVTGAGGTFAHWAHRWNDEDDEPSPKTKASHWSALTHHLLPVWGREQIDGISRAQVSELLLEKHRAGKLAPSSVKNLRSAASKVFGWALHFEVIDVNPCIGAKIPKQIGIKERDTYVTLTPEQVAALAAEIGIVHDQYALAVKVAAYCGPRAGELWALKVSDMLPAGDGGALDINKSWTGSGAKTLTAGGKTGAAVRLVPVLAPLWAELKAHIEVYDLTDTDYLFTNRERRPVMQDSFRPRHFVPAVERCRQADPSFPKGFVFHDLRHTAATLMKRAGVPQSDAVEIMGHSRRVTMLSDTVWHAWRVRGVGS